MSLHRPSLIAACIFGGSSIIIGALGAHKLSGILTPELMNSFETGVRFQFYHALALLFVGILYHFIPNNKIKLTFWMFVLGIILFSGSIYFLVLMSATQDIGLGNFGLITPIGGIFFLMGWIFLLLSVLGKDKLKA